MNYIRKYFQIDHLHYQNITGKNITVAILDTGAYAHKDYSNHIIHFKDFITNQKYPFDDNSHGTHVCGIIGGSGKMSNGLYKGMAPQSLLVPIKVLNSKGIGDSQIITDGINWIKNNHQKYNIRIVNISIGTEAFSCEDEQSELVKAVDSLWDLGITNTF